MTKEEKKAYDVIYHAAYYAAHKKEKKAHDIKYRATHKKEIKASREKWYAAHKYERIEYNSVKHHYYLIFKSKDKRSRTYRDMPFFDGWNPDKGGSLKAGSEWIIKNLGKRAPSQSLHIVKHELGFIPGNLAWATTKIQNAEQMFKIIARLEHENKELKELLREYQCQKAK